MQVRSPSSQDNSPTMITPYQQDSYSKKNDVQLLLEEMVELAASMKNEMTTMGNQIVDFGKPYQHKPAPILGKVDVHLKKPPDNWAKKKLIKAGDKVMQIIEHVAVRRM
ncbi:uncharacterized protein G2W53_007533 [Senna tora]|uniref:Uncharacterized protein n=1 Tax=Senna tora TaxID=362788 RepID=A0A835CDS0_9FABA|nr:uncharacterized protein G2W53_007533 [Senna tora]